MEAVVHYSGIRKSYQVRGFVWWGTLLYSAVPLIPQLVLSRLSCIYVKRSASFIYFIIRSLGSAVRIPPHKKGMLNVTNVTDHRRHYGIILEFQIILNILSHSIIRIKHPVILPITIPQYYYCYYCLTNQLFGSNIF